MRDPNRCLRARCATVVVGGVLLLITTRPATALDFSDLFVEPGSGEMVLLRPDEPVRIDMWSDGLLVDPPQYEYTARECDTYLHDQTNAHYSCRQNHIDWGISPPGDVFGFYADPVEGDYWATWHPTDVDVGTRAMQVTALFITTLERSEFDGCMPSCVDGHWSFWDEETSEAPVHTEAVDVVVTDVRIEKVEITQAIQENRTPIELRDHLAANAGEAPVPLVADKAGAVRMFLSEVAVPTPVRVDLWAVNLSDPNASVLEDSKDVDLVPGCTADDRRARTVTGTQACRGVDFRFGKGVLTEGTWAIWVGLFYRPDAGKLIIEPHHRNLDGSLASEWAQFAADYGYLPGEDPDGSPHGASLLPSASGAEKNVYTNGGLEDFKFVVEATPSDDILIHGVSVCDQPLSCEPARRIRSMTGLFEKLAPTARVRVGAWRDRIRGVHFLSEPSTGAPACSDGTTTVPWTHPLPIYCQGDLWWDRVLLELSALRARRGALALPGEQHAVYGVVSPDLLTTTAGAAQQAGMGGWVAASLSSVVIGGQETNVGVLAHEMGHAMGLPHTGTSDPFTGTYPGCTGLAARSTVGPDSWPYDDSHLQSGKPGDGGPGRGVPEVGYDYEKDRVRAKDGPRESYEMMSYCRPRWTTPWSTLLMLDEVRPGGAATAAEAAVATETSVLGDFWLLSGSIDGSGADLLPLVAATLDGPTGSGAGTHRVEARSAADAVLAARWFEPVAGQREVPGVVDQGPAMFSVLLPVTVGTSRIVVVDDVDAEIASVALGGEAPAVVLDSPAGGETWQGFQDVAWTVTDADSGITFAWIDYSADAGASWHRVTGGTIENPLTVDFDALPGGTGTALLRVAVSDGASTTTVVSAPFSVTKKLPVVEILEPRADETFHIGDQVILEGTAFDYDDGPLAGASLAWSIVGLGAIGTGEELPIDVDQSGRFTLTLVATDSDGNQATASVDVDVLPTPDEERSSGGPPVALAGGPYTAVEGTPVLVSGAASYDPDGGPLVYAWDFGGGSTASGESALASYADDGLHAVDLVVTDGELLTDGASATISVQNAAPRVDTVWSYQTGVDEPVLLQGSFEDAGVLDGPWSVTWDFGDGTPPESQQTSTPGAVNRSHTYAADGPYYARLTVQDKDGGTGTAEMVVYVPEPAPLAAWIVGVAALRGLARRGSAGRRPPP